MTKTNLILLALIIPLSLIVFELKTIRSNLQTDLLKPPSDTFNIGDSIAKKYSNNPIFINDDDKISDKESVAGNCLFVDNEKLMLLYYAEFNGSSAVFLASSDDGVNFSNVSSAPVLESGHDSQWDSGGVSVFPNCVIKKNDGTYLIYYTGIGTDTGDIYHSGQIGIAESKDLLTWKKHSSNPILSPSESGWDSWGVFEPSVEFSGNQFGKPDAYKMWYGGSDKNLRFQIGYATSSDGLSWEKFENRPVFSYSGITSSFDNYSVEVHSVFKYLGKYIMFYEAISEQFPEPFSIGFAESVNGIDWKRSENNPILGKGVVGTWDQMGAYHPSFIEYNGRLFLYYVGLDFEFTHRIGVSELNPVVFYKTENINE